ncbi:MAG TPA: mandelate racemase/muconate lactonizing enzyme family protein [Pilimelia sp.]|nr:mandelate racemase/muconate lactonizing enzyme family protein [Pilimelia sp.]
MRITKVDAFLLSSPLPEPMRMTYHGGERTVIKRDALLVRATADNGLCGWAPGVADEATVRAIDDWVSPFLSGRDPRQLQGVALNGTRVIANAYRAAEIAVLDLLGRYEGCPVTDLIGGRVRDTITLYASGGMYQPPDGYAEEAAGAEAMGFHAYKMRPGGGPDADVATVDAVRRATGADFELMIDAHTWWRMGDFDYDYDTVVALAKAFGPLRVTWLEEPLPPADHAAYRRLRADSPVPIATGEHEPDEIGLVTIASSGVTDYVQADLCSHGGFSLGPQVFGAVRDAGRKFAFHSWGTLLEVITAAQLGVCWPEDVVPWLEYPLHANAGRAGIYPFPLADDVLTEPLDVRDGVLHVPDAPGLGIEVDETVIERYPYLPGPWSTFRLRSPAHVFAVVGDHSITEASLG